MTLEFETLHQQPFPLPHYRGIGRLPTFACKVAQTHDLSQGVILQQENATPRSTCQAQVGADILLEASGPFVTASGETPVRMLISQ